MRTKQARRQIPKKADSKQPLLAEYQAKRDFAHTPEPPPTVRSARAGQRGGGRRKKTLYYCVQKHQASRLHYDFRLEHDGVLLSWAVPKGPSLRPQDKRLAVRVEDHPLDYRTFEGVIPSGYGAGIVMLWDKGVWQPDDPDVSAALAAGRLTFTLKGVKLKGAWTLVRTKAQSQQEQWLLMKRKDAWAGELDITQAAPLSVKSFGDFDDIAKHEKSD